MFQLQWTTENNGNDMPSQEKNETKKNKKNAKNDKETETYSKINKQAAEI